MNSLADVESLLNCLILLNTFTIGFAINFISNVSYDELIGMDQRFASIWFESDVSSFFTGVPENKVIIMSSLLSYRTWTAIILISVSLFITVGILIGMNYSDCREDKRFFEAWEKFTRPGIAASFVLYIVGSIYLYSATGVFSFASFPKYCGTTTTTYAVYAEKSDVYNATSGEMIQGCVLSNIDKVGAGGIRVINVLCPLFCCFFIFLSHYLRTISVYFGYDIEKEVKPIDVRNPVNL